VTGDLSQFSQAQVFGSTLSYSLIKFSPCGSCTLRRSAPSEPYPNSLGDGWTFIDFQSGGLRDVGSQLRAEFCHVIGEECGRVAGAGDGDLGEARVEQVRVDARIGTNENAFGSEALGAVARDGIAVVEMTMLVGVEFDPAVAVEADGQASIRVDCLDRRHVAICNAEPFVGGSKLDAVAQGKLALDLVVDADAGKAAGIVGRKLSVRFLDREFVCGWIDRDNRCVGGSFDSDGFAAACVANYVVDPIVAGPGSFGSGHVLTLNQHKEITIFRGNGARGLQLLANREIQFVPGALSGETMRVFWGDST
jgi:hypothetical protein